MYLRPLRIAGSFILLFITAGDAAAQVPMHPGTPADVLSSATITVHVLGPTGRPLEQQAFVMLYKFGTSTPLSTLLTSRDSEVVFSDMPGFGRYTVAASSAGYRTESTDVNYDSFYTRQDVDISLHPLSGDAGPAPAPKLAPKVQKHVKYGLGAMQLGKFLDAQKELIEAYNAAPQNADVCYLLGVAYLKSKDFQHAELYLGMATSINPNHVSALVTLGQLRHMQKDYQLAIAPLEKAASLDPKEWLARWILADIYLRGGEYEKARQNAHETVELRKEAANKAGSPEGKEAVIKAGLIEGQALGQLGRRDKAIKVLEAFLRDAPKDPAAPAVQALIAKLQSSTPEAPRNSAASERAEVSGTAGAPDDDFFTLLVPTWQPPSVDAEKPAIAEGLACPADHVIEEAGKRVTELVDSVNRIAATEDIFYEDLSQKGRPISTYTRKFDYVIDISENSTGLLLIDEYRHGESAPQEYAQHMAPFALGELALIFHPQMRIDFQMRCEGLGKWQGQATWLVYFRQRPDRPQRIRTYISGNNSYSPGLKGRAWISAGTFQIVRLEAELMAPIPQLGLSSERDAIEYGPVPLKKEHTELWLPMTAEIFFYYRHYPYHRRHTFSNYDLFSVNANQKFGQPKQTTEEK
jgi:tetratricopeptide (TPR) repeat protein